MKNLEQLKILDNLKKSLLLNSHGHVYFLKGYEVESRIRIWPFKKTEEVKYVSKIYTSIGDLDEFNENFKDLIKDKNRYLTMLSSLNKLDYKVIRK